MYRFYNIVKIILVMLMLSLNNCGSVMGNRNASKEKCIDTYTITIINSIVLVSIITSSIIVASVDMDQNTKTALASSFGISGLILSLAAINNIYLSHSCKTY